MYQQSQRLMRDKLLLHLSFFLTAGSWLMHLSLFWKVIFTIITGITSIMAFMNQYKTLQKNYKTMWIIVQVEEVLVKFQPKKNRHKKNISHPKKTEND